MSYLLSLHSYNMCQIMFTLHVYGMTFMMGGEQEGRWRLQLREMAAKPETTASDGSLTYVGVQELDF